MEWNLKSTGIIVAIFLIGYIIGLVEAAIKQKNKDKKNAGLEEKELVELPPDGLKQPNLLSINRNASNGLDLEFEGQTISNKEELSPENKLFLVTLLAEVHPWLESTAATPITPSIETQPEPVNFKPQIASAAIPPLPASSPEKKPVSSRESIVSQINSILQSRLAVSPYANQGISLQESLTGGVIVYVGMNKYDGIDGIPDPEIKEFIRQAVAEWERRS